MNKILPILALLMCTLFAEVINEFPSQKLLDSKIKIIDIRTLGEWKEYGLLKGSIPLTFFDERGNYNIPYFMAELKKHVKPNEKFALICHVGSRTAMLAEYLDQTHHMKVVNLKGGIEYAKGKGLTIVPYK